MISPSLVINIYLVEHGYQVDILDSKQNTIRYSECRDFAGKHNVEELKKEVISGIIEGFEVFRNGK